MSRQCTRQIAAVTVLLFSTGSWSATLVGDEPSIVAPSATEASWTRFRGPRGQGISPATTVPTSFSAVDYNWRVELPGRGHSSPVIFGDLIFLTWIDAESGQRTLGCVSTHDGSIRWRYRNAFEKYEQHADNSFAASTPVVDDQRVYCYWSSGSEQLVIAVNHAGDEVWQKSVGEFGAQWGTGSSPMLADGVLIIANDNETRASFLAGLDPATGDEVWRRPRASTRSSYSTPMIFNEGQDGMTVLFASTSHGLTCLRARDGALIWELDGLFQQRCVGSPVFAGGLIYQFAGSGTSGKEAVAVAPPEDSEQDSQPTIRHKLRGSLPYVPTPIASGPWIFLWSDSGILSCVEAKDGEVIYRQRLDASFYGSPICIDGKMYCISREGELFIVAADADFRLIARIDLGEASSATPAVDNGVLYLRTESHLISVGGAK